MAFGMLVTQNHGFASLTKKLISIFCFLWLAHPWARMLFLTAVEEFFFSVLGDQPISPVLFGQIEPLVAAL